MAIRTQTRPIGAFDRIELKYTGEILLSQGEEVALSVEADEETLPKLKTEVRGSTLVLELGGDWLERLMGGIFSLGRGRVRYHVTVRELRGIRISGQGRLSAPALHGDRLELNSSGLGRIEIAALTADLLNVNISGRGELSLKGTVREQSIFVSGSGDYQAKELASHRASVRISGHGNVTLAVSENLDVSISGYGRVGYYGEPAVSRSITGAGQVERLTGLGSAQP